MTIDYERFYKLLERMKVRIPEPDPANPAELQEISRLLARVNNNRTMLDGTARKLDRMLGSVKNDIEIWKEKVRLARAEAILDSEAMAKCSNKEERAAMVDLMTRSQTATLATLQAKRAGLEHARTAVESLINTLKAAKETLNSMKSIILNEQENLQ